eukprot:gene11946-15055_t
MFKKFANAYESIYSPTFHGSSYGVSLYRPISRSFFKLWEILHDFEPDLRFGRMAQCKKHPVRAAFLAEGPGGFMEAFTKYRYDYGTCEGDEYHGITLVDRSSRSIPGWRIAPIRRLARSGNACGVWLHNGEDGTGNLYNICNVDNFVDAVGGKGTVDFVTADGGFDFSGNFNHQEERAMQLVVAQLYTAMCLQKHNGKKCLKWCQSMEAYDVESQYMKQWRNTNERPRMGIMGLPPGSGKTAIMASLVLNTSECNADTHGVNPYDTVRDKSSSSTRCYASIPMMSKEDMRVWGNVTFVIASANLVSYWYDTMNKMGVPESRIISVPSHVKMCTETLVDNISNAKVVIFSPASYSRLMKRLNSSNTHRCVRRLIIDEADSLLVPSGILIPNIFIWLVTGTHSSSTYKYPQYMRHLITMPPIKCDRYVVSVYVDMTRYPPVVFNQLNEFTKTLDTLHAVRKLDIQSVNDIQKSLPTDTIQLGKLMKNVTYQDSFHGADLGCDALLPLDFTTQLPDPVSEEEFLDNFDRMRTVRSTIDLVHTILQDAEQRRDHVNIIVFRDTTMGEDMQELVEKCVSRFGYTTQLIGTYLTQEKQLLKFGKEKTVLIMNTGSAQGLNIPQADVIIVTHTLAPAKFKQLVARARRPPRTKLVKVFHMQLCGFNYDE